MTHPATRIRPALRRAVLSRAFVPAALLLGAALRLAWVVIVDPEPVSDAERYYALAVHLAAGDGYSNDHAPTAYWPPGYPAFLAAIFAVTGPAVGTAQLANVALATASLGLAYYVAKETFGSELTGRITALILAVYPNQIAYTSLVMSEVLFTSLLLLLAALIIWGRGRRWALAATGLLLAAACLVRPQAMPVPAVLLLLLPAPTTARLRRAALEAGLVYAACAVALVPWAMRNYAVFGAFVPLSTNGGVNLYVGNNPDANGGYVWTERMGYLLQQEAGANADEADRDAAARRLAVRFALDQPLTVLGLLPEKLSLIFGTEFDGAHWNVHGLLARDPDMVHRLARLDRFVIGPFWTLVRYGVVAAVAALLALRAFGMRWVPWSWVPLAVIAALTAFYLPFFGNARYHFPMAPWLVMYLGAAIALILSPAAATDSGRNAAP